MPISAGDTFLLRPTHNSDPHLWIVLTDPEDNPPQVVVVNLTSLRPGADLTVALNRGDHPFVRHETVVFFGDARFAEARSLDKAVGVALASRLDAVSVELLQRVQEGLLASDETPRRIKEYCRTRF